MTSLPPSDCCTQGIIHEGTPSGTIEKIGNISTYISRPASAYSSNKAIIIFSDIFGIYKNAQLIADDFAKRGYLTVIPDLFRGDSIAMEDYDSGKVDLHSWLPKHTPAHVDPVSEIIIDYLRTTLQVKYLCGVGYCYGGKHVIRNLKSGSLDSGYVAHPSFVTVEELKAITKPLSIAAAEIDSIFTRKLRAESEEILASLHIPYQVNLYGGVAHGFALRGDLGVKEVKFATDGAFEQAISWFEMWSRD